MATFALINAAGSGLRFGSSIAKQFEKFKEKPILAWCLELFQNTKNVDYIYVVSKPADFENVIYIAKKYGISKFKSCINGGNTANESRFYGLKSLKENQIIKDSDIVIFHDAVRIAVSQKTIEECVKNAKKYNVCVTGRTINANILCSMSDFSARLSRNIYGSKNLFLCSMPFGIRADLGYEMFNEANEVLIGGVDSEAGPQGFLFLIKGYIGEKYKKVEINYIEDLKITYKEDLEILEKFL